VEYVQQLLRHFGFAVSYIYGAMDQAARKLNLNQFRKKQTSILVAFASFTLFFLRSCLQVLLRW
jgi:superfamily II DNA helicase RecQ